MLPTQYFEWNYNKGTVIEYERTGSCCLCGKCCMATISYELCNQEGYRVGKFACLSKTVVEEKGIWLEVRQGGLRLFSSSYRMQYKNTSSCSYYDDGLCILHPQSVDVAPLCKFWPLHPAHVEMFPECTYKFNKVNEWEFKR